jgi:hypothetical protein
LKKELSKEKYHTCPGGRCQGELNGSFRTFRKNAKDLNKEERKTLRRFFAYSPDAKQAYDFREELTALYEMNLSKKQAQAKILRWILRVEKVACCVSRALSVYFGIGGRRLPTFLFTEKTVVSWKASIRRSKFSNAVATVFSISSIYSSASILT